jgi:hypothetical protein
MSSKTPFSNVISRISAYKEGSKQKRIAKKICINNILMNATISNEQKGYLIIQVNSL